MTKKVSVILFLIMLSFCGLIAQEKKLKFSKQLSILNGLAHNGVTSILEDSRGYLWFGTYDGLNKYDGYELKILKNTIDKNLLVSNRVRTLNEDKNGNIWIGTDEGVSIYNYSQERFRNIYSNKLVDKTLSGPIVRKLLMNNEEGIVLCLTEKSGILVFNNNYTFSKQCLPSKKISEKNILFYDGIRLDSTNYIFTTSIGLISFNIISKKFDRVLKQSVSSANSILKIDQENFLVTLQNGVAFIEFKLDSVAKKYNFILKHKKLKAHQFNSSMLDTLGNLWLGTLNKGIIHIDDIYMLMNNIKFTQTFFKHNVKSLRVSSIVSTSNNTCWVSTFNEGVFQFDIHENPFKTYNTEMGYDYSIQSNFINQISVFDESKVYVSASRGGVGLFNTKRQRFKSLPFNIPKNIFLNTNSVYVDSRRNTWMKINNKNFGFCRVKPGKKEIEVLTHEKVDLLKNITPRSYAEDRNGNIWIGSHTGVFKITLDKANKIVNIESLNNHPFFINNNLTKVRYIYADPFSDFIWLGADSDGLFRIDIKNNKPIAELTIKQFLHEENNKQSISSNFVTSIVRLPNEELWIGTEGGGICKVIEDEDELKFISFSEKQGLSNNAVKNILYDNEYNLWITTNIGLNKFNTKDNSFRSFSKSDGLPFEDFWFASVRLNNGTIVLSGIDGVCYFNPKDIPNKKALPKLNFEELSIFNKNILPGDTIHNRVLLNKRLSDKEELTLKYNENVFSLKLTSLHFSDPVNHHLKYRLLPINEDWIEVPSNQQYIHYNGLPPGEYTLSVLASNSLNDWTEPKTLKILITPPFWETPLAYLIYIIVGALVIYVVGYFILRIQSLNHNLEIEQLEKDNVKEVNAAKLRFFSNISHEIKTPLTLISGPIDILLERFKGNVDVKHKLELVERQSKKISQLIDQVHDFQRADANLLKMNYTNFCFDLFIQDLVSDFNFMAKNDQKRLEISGEQSDIYVSADKDKLEKIFNNLINNAFKYTKPNDVIRIEYEHTNNNLTVIVSDTGKGIDSDDLPHVFERFYQSHTQQTVFTGGSGIGLAFSKRLVDMHYGYINVESEISEGSKFIVCLPIVRLDIDVNQEKTEKKILLAEESYVPKDLLTNEVNVSAIKVDGSLSETQIFFAEDNTDMRMFVSGVLSNFFKVKTFRNGQECIDAMEDEWPDIVISDVQMPELSGFDLCKRIKTDIKTSHIPVVLLTALTALDDQLHGLSDGADAYIKKPFDMQHLVTRIEALLRSRKKLRERFQIELPLTLEKNSEITKDTIFLEKLYNLMAENLDNQELDFNELAKKLYLNRTHFYQKVKALTNQTPFELFKMYRLKKAAELLVQKKLSVNEVYVMTGFKSRTHFSKLFKEKYNVTPGKYASESKKKFS